MSKVIGIDLGTGNSCVAVIENGKPVVIANSEGNRTTPSIVSFKNGERKVGAAAKRQAVMNPTSTINIIKRFMGTELSDVDVQRTIEKVAYSVVDNGAGKPRVEIDGNTYSPEEISSYILNAMKKIAEDYYGEDVKDAVVTCPAWYTNSQREAVKLAGQLAGLNVLRVINEPTAAILSSAIKTDKDKLVLVADCGQGTTDWSLCDITSEDGEQVIEVLASYGDVFLGGQDYDNAVVDYLADEFAKEHGGFDLKKDQMAYARLVEAAEKAKCELSSSPQTDINLPYITIIDNVPQMFVTTLTKAKFDQITESLNHKVIECGRECLRKAGKDASEVSDLLLIGGTTRIPKLQDDLYEAFQIKLDKSANPDEAVALGAAVQANIITGGSDSANVLLLDVTPITLGIETMGGVMTTLVEANTTIPVTKSKIFSTAADNQPSVDIVVLQGERPMAADNKTIGHFSLDGIAPARRGVPQIEVAFEIDANGIVNVKATDKATGKEQAITIKNSNSLSKEEIESIKANAEKFSEEDKKKTEEIKELNELESYSYTFDKIFNEDADKYSKFVSSDEKEKIKELSNAIHEAVVSKDIATAKEKKAELEKLWEPISKKIYESAASNNASQNPFEGNASFADAMNSMYNKKPDSQNSADTAEEVPYAEA